MPGINYEEDQLKHYVRVKGWLPLCKRRRTQLQTRPEKQKRRLRYFTFCAVNAVDVYMLEVARVIRRSGAAKFDTVFFFDRTREDVDNTQARIPGATGFVGDFVEVVLADDAPAGSVADLLAPPDTDPNTEETRDLQRLAATRQSFKESFPFDVVNLDLEEFIFKEKDPFPGKVVNALRKVFEWQRRPLRYGKYTESLGGFTLMFTTQVGPPVLADDYANMLHDHILRNLGADATLAAILEGRAGSADVTVLRADALGAFFEVGVPKVLLAMLQEQDWHVDSRSSVRVFRFTRPWKDGTYDILHFAMDVLRQAPPIGQRAPGQLVTAAAQQAYRLAAVELMGAGPVVVTAEMVVLDELRPTLEQIKARRRHYVGDE